MAATIKRIAVNTGGGDAPGLNAVIRSIVLSALRRGWEVLGIRNGYEGLFDTTKIVQLDRNSVRGITHLGGTILGTTNRNSPFEYPEKQADGTTALIDRSAEVVENFKRLQIDALIAIGGDGSMVTFGFDTAVTVATEAIDRLHSTAEAHERVFVVEVMGRYAGWIALHAGVSATADVVLIPEIPFDLGPVCDKIMDREARGRRFSIVVAAEGATPVDGRMVSTDQGAGREVLLGGIAEQIAKGIGERTGKETRTVVLGHLQRGGSPTTFDRLLALRFGAAAVRMVAGREFGVMVALDPPTVLAVPLEVATERMKCVPLDSDTMLTARDLGISFGDEVGEG